MAVSHGPPDSTGANGGGVWQPVLVPVINHAGSFVVTPVFEAPTANREGTALIKIMIYIIYRTFISVFGQSYLKRE